MATRETNKTVISINDEILSYITIQKNAQGYDVTDYGEAYLPQGVVVRGEILKADFLGNALKKIAQKISQTNIDIMIPHEYFLCKNAVLENAQKKETLKDRVQQYFNNKETSEEWQSTHICEFSIYPVAHQKDTVFFKCLNKEMYQSYEYVVTLAGLQMDTISSEILAYSHLIPPERTFLISLQKNYALVSEFKNGIYLSAKKFQVSYEQFTGDIKKNISLSDEEAYKILKKYGVLRSHKDERVYKRLMQSMSPLLDYISKRKISDQYTILVTFADTPVLGFVDAIAQATMAHSEELDIITTNQYNFADILSLHRDDSYKFSALIAQALKTWK